MSAASPFDRLDQRTCDALRERLRGARYDDEILAWAESIAPGVPDAVRLPVVQWNLERRGASAALLFAYDARVPRADAEELLGAELVRALLDAGALEAEGTDVRSTVRVLPVGELYVMGDVPTRGPDAVMPPGPTTLQLLRAMPERIAGTVLDIGCGPGAFALAACARGASRAVGVDISARAVEAARACARLNRLACEFSVGDLTAPVRGARFDLVVAQPPYVVTPPEAEAVTFLHGGRFGDELALRVLGEIPGVLADGGQALVLFDTPVRKSEPLHARVRAALGDAEVDVVILAARGLAPDVQACGYATLEAPSLDLRYSALVRAYRAHLAALGVEAVTHALVLLRASPAGMTVTLPVARLPRSASAVAGLWAALVLASKSDDALLCARVRPSPHARWVEERARPGAEAPSVRIARFSEESIGADHEISEAATALCEALDASESVKDAIGRYAAVCEASPDEVSAQALAFVREGLARSLLAPA